MKLENDDFSLAFDLPGAAWAVAGKNFRLASPLPNVSYQPGAGRLPGARWQVTASGEIDSPHGALRRLSLASILGSDGLRLEADYALPVAGVGCFWRLRLENLGRQPVAIQRLVLLESKAWQPGAPAAGEQGCASLSFFTNGWQSWSFAGALAPTQRFQPTYLGPLRVPAVANPFTPYSHRPGVFGSDMFGVLGDRARRVGLLLGFLSQKEQFGVLQAHLDRPLPTLALWADGDGALLNPGARLESDWACLYWVDLDAPDPLGPYVEAAARQHGGPRPLLAHGNLTGWCSWYQFSTEDYQGAVSAEDIRTNLAAVAGLRPSLPLDLVQIDDGFEAQVGDWYAFKAGFPDEVAPLATEIRQAGLTPGLWLAPFIVHPQAHLASKHPGWLLRHRSGRPANAGFLWGAFAAALDLTNPAALAYAQEVVHTAVHRWGFPYLKLDFLYAAALPGERHDPTRTRAQALRLGLEGLRQAAGEETILLGCGCPLGPAIGLVDAMRIGADTARRWQPSFLGLQRIFDRESSFPAARNASHAALARSALHRRWWLNDPDCLLVRPGTDLTLAEVQTQATIIALTGGSMLLSDHLPALPPERQQVAAALLPLIGQRPHLPGWFDSPMPCRARLDLSGPAGEWQLLALFNWDAQPRNLALDVGEFGLEPGRFYLGREFWSGRVLWASGQRARFEAGWVDAHGVMLLAVRRFNPGVPLYLGSDLHISQGLEAAGWETGPGWARLSLVRPGPAHGHFDLYLPARPAWVQGNGCSVSYEALAANCYRFEVQFDRQAEVLVELDLSFPSPG